MLGKQETMGSLYDIFPTVLMWLDLAVPRDAVGSARTDWMEHGWAAEHPFSVVDSYGEGYREATPPRQPPNNANEEFMDGMRSLGYF